MRELIESETWFEIETNSMTQDEYYFIIFDFFLLLLHFLYLIFAVVLCWVYMKRGKVIMKPDQEMNKTVKKKL